MKQARRFLIFLFILYGAKGLAAPSWSKDQTVKHVSDKVIIVTCSGSGLAKDLAFQNAVRQCGSIAANEVNSSFTTKSVVIETESDSPRLHSEVSSEKQVTGLKPKTEREFTEPVAEGFVTFLQANYDLSRATVTSVRDDTSDADVQTPSRSIESMAKDKSSSEIQTKKSAVSFERTLTISMLPEKCSDYLIRGKRPRSFSCSANPMQVMVNVAEDTEIILRPATSTLLPKTLKIHKQREPASDYDAEVIDVQFDRH